MLLNNWIGTQPTFLNSSNKQNLGSQLTKLGSLEPDDVGLFLYLKAGYCIFGKTPYRDITFLRANQKISEHGFVDGNYTFLEKLMNERTTSVDSVLDSLSKWIETFEKNTQGKIIVPLSGGLDSRLIISMITDRSRIEAFTYGQSWNQSKSNEVIRAEALSKKMGFKWRHITLSGYSRFTSSWIENRGPTSHAHGMYQMDFYSQIRNLVPKDSVVLSGIVGDALAGSLPKVKISKPRDLWELTLSHNINASALLSHIKYEKINERVDKVLEKEYELYEELLSSKRVTDLITLQNKNMLLRYLVEVPELFGFHSQSPFLDEKIGTDLLRLEENQRENRKWQKEYLRMIRLDDQSLGKGGLHNNTLNFVEINSKRVDLSLLDSLGIFRNEESVIEEVKAKIQTLQSVYFKLAVALSQKPLYSLLGRIMLKLRGKSYRLGLKMYYCYLTLIPLSFNGKAKPSHPYVA
jgi:asparagine synthetase B (glutamine-hydrolysing)